ncbi:hypothetical protein IQ26_06659 [Mesorhizobium tianshanense]|uniref:Uncharacterized protein n=1 Tax=Mesorhizobium tianshanense TaxID=39844 RepID=A0A562MRT2_9HYPH|nr:hypothetical protein IQ26_06659 [Mesorhizobium tianshanense]
MLGWSLRSARSSRKRPGSAATCPSSGTRSIICRASTATTACRSCAGSMTGATLPRPISLHRWPNGRRAIPGSPPGSRRTSNRRSPSSGCLLGSIDPASTACSWSERSPSRPTKTGWRPTATSTWTICASTRSSLYAKPRDQLHARSISDNPTDQVHLPHSPAIFPPASSFDSLINWDHVLQTFPCKRQFVVRFWRAIVPSVGRT